MNIIDTHIHFDLKQFNQDLENVISRAKNKGLDKFVIPAVQSDKMEKIIHLVNSYEDIYFASGNHPNYLESFDINTIKKYAIHEKCVAIGECGLDWYRIPNGANINDIKRKQIDIFKQQIELAIDLQKPLILHSRETDDDMLETLLQYKGKLHGGVVHCYVGSEKLLKLLDENFYFGIGGVLTYKTATDLRTNIKKIPLNRIVLETDGPYLTPFSMKNKSKFNEPSYIPFIIKELHELLKINEEQISTFCYNNSLKLFNLK